MIPTGISKFVRLLAIVSANIMNAAPPAMLNGTRLLWSGPVIILTRWGTIRPTQPMMPLTETAILTANEEAAIKIILSLFTFTPSVFTSFSPLLIAFSSHLLAKRLEVVASVWLPVGLVLLTGGYLWFRPNSLAVFMVNAAILIAAVSGIWWHVQRPTEKLAPAEGVRTTPVAEPAPAPPGPPSGDTGVETPSMPIRLRVVAEENCWLEVYADGRRVFLGTLRAGEAYRVEATTQVRLATVGNAGALRVFLNDRPLPPLGGPGETRRDVVFDTSRLPTGGPPSPE